MHSFKGEKMKIYKRFLKIAIVVIVAVAVSGFLNFILVPVSYAHWVNNDIKNNASQIDTVFLGSSTVFCGIDPKLFDENTGDTFAMNCGSASQKLMDSYYYLLDLKYCCKNIKNVFIDVYPVSFMNQEGNEASELQRKMILIDRYNKQYLKYKYIAAAFTVDDVLYGLLPFTYYNDRIYQSADNLKNKLSKDYRTCSYSYDGFDVKYEGMGYIPYRYEPVEDLSLDPSIKLSKTHNPEAFEYLDKIIAFCSEQNINLFFIEMPLTQIAYEQEKPYTSEIKAKILQKANDNNIPFLDLNELRDKNILDDNDFHVAEHLNVYGSQKVTEILAEFYMINRK